MCHIFELPTKLTYSVSYVFQNTSNLRLLLLCNETQIKSHFVCMCNMSMELPCLERSQE